MTERTQRRIQDKNNSILPFFFFGSFCIHKHPVVFINTLLYLNILLFAQITSTILSFG